MDILLRATGPWARAAGLLAALALASPVGAAGQETDSIPLPDTTDVADTVEVAPAETDTTANFTGTVASARTGEPLSGARLSIPDLQFGAITDDEGNFRIRKLPPGLYDVRVHYLGYTTNQRPIRLRPGQVTNVTFLLERDVLEVADLTVEVKQPDRMEPMAGFRERMEQGFGYFITREDIEERNPRYTSDMLRSVPGLDVNQVDQGQGRVTIRCSGRKAYPVVFLDGALVRNFPVDNIQPGRIQGIEVYSGPSETPGQFQVGGAGCGVIVIHTRVASTNPRAR